MERPQFFKDLDRSLSGEPEPEPENAETEVRVQATTRVFYDRAAYQAQKQAVERYYQLSASCSTNIPFDQVYPFNRR